MAKNGKLRQIVLLLCSLLFVNSQAFAGSLTGELDKAEGTLEDQFIYTLAVQGSADAEPKFPEIADIKVRSAGTSQSVSIVNGRMSREVQYQFVLIPAKEGAFVIPAIELMIDGKKQQTLPIEFKVTAAGTTPGANRERLIFIERSLSKNKVYVGESLISSIRVFSRVRILAAEPDFRYPDGFQVKKIDGEKSYTKVVDGQEFVVTEINAILSANKEGKFEVPGASLGVRYVDQSKARRSPGSMLQDIWGQSHTAEKQITSSATTLDVLPLPVAGRRADFSGLVGEFSGRAEVSTRSVKTDETVTVTLTVEGKGATTGMADPELALGDRAKIYKDKPQSQDTYDASQGVIGKRSFKLAVVPLQSGELDLGTIKLQFFNTTLGHYQDLPIELGKIQVSASTNSRVAGKVPGNQAENFAAEPKVQAGEVKSLGMDLLEPHPPERLQAEHRLQLADFVSAGVLVFASWMFTGFGAWKSYIRRQGGRLEVRKKAGRALKNAQREMRVAHGLLARQDTRSAVDLAQKTIRRYLGDKFDIKGGGLTLRDLELQLEQHGLTGQILEDMRKVWQNLDQLLFAAATADPAGSREILQKVDTLLQEVEQRCEH